MTAPDSSGLVHVSGHVVSRATVFVHNERTDQIAGEVTGESGRYGVAIEAEVGDSLLVWQSVQTRESPPTEIVVPEMSDSDGTPPAPPMGGASGE